MKQIYLYDEEMMFTGVDVIDSNELPENATDIKPADGLYKAKFDGENWIETISDEELQQLNKVDALIPSTEERLEAIESALLDLASSL